MGGRQAYAIALDSFSNVYITGYSYNPGSYFDYCTVKYTSDGLQQWVKYYTTPGFAQDDARKIAIDNAGNVYVTGESLLGNFQFATIKYSPTGTELWVRRYGTPDGNTFVNGLEIDNNCNIYITGVNNDSAITIKYDSSGTLVWANRYCSNAGNAESNDIVLDANNVYITGYTTTTHREFFTIKYSSAGLQLWERKYNTDTLQKYSRYEANSISLDNLGDIYVSGFFFENQSSPRRLCLIKYSNDGNLIWERKDTASISNETTLMAVDEVGNAYVAGSTGFTYMFLKYSNTGTFLWRIIYSSLATSPRSLKVDKNYNIYLTGSGAGRILTLKYSQSVGIEQISLNEPDEFKLEQNFPNPFNPTTSIKFHVTNSSDIKLSIFDVLGREAAILVNEHLKAGVYQASWNAENYPSGVYFAVFTAGEHKFTKKMVLIK
jgi:hypothetical protein